MALLPPIFGGSTTRPYFSTLTLFSWAPNSSSCLDMLNRDTIIGYDGMMKSLEAIVDRTATDRDCYECCAEKEEETEVETPPGIRGVNCHDRNIAISSEVS